MFKNGIFGQNLPTNLKTSSSMVALLLHLFHDREGHPSIGTGKGREKGFKGNSNFIGGTFKSEALSRLGRRSYCVVVSV